MPVFVLAEANHSNANTRVMLNKAMPLIMAEKKDVLFALEQRANQPLESLVDRLSTEINAVKRHISEEKKKGNDLYQSQFVEPIYALVKTFSLEQLLKLLQLENLSYQGIDLDIGQGRARENYDEINRVGLQLSAKRSEVMAYNLLRVYFENPERTVVVLIGGHHLEAIKRHIITWIGEEEAKNFDFCILNTTQPVPLPDEMPASTKRLAQHVMKNNASSFFDTTKPEQLKERGIMVLDDKNLNTHKEFAGRAIKENKHKKTPRFYALAMYYRAISLEENQCIHHQEKEALLMTLEQAIKNNESALIPDKELAVIAMIRRSLYKKSQELLGPKNWGSLVGTLFCCNKYKTGTFGFRLNKDKYANVAFTLDKVSKILTNQRESVYLTR